VTTLALFLSLLPGSIVGLWPGMAAAGVLGVGAAWWASRAQAPMRWRPTRRDIAFGVLGGVAMVCATHLSYAPAIEAVPALAHEARLLYARLDEPPGRWSAVPLIVLVVIAEELVWRGVAYPHVERRFGRLAAVAIVTITYGIPQLGSGSWLLVLLALACGFVWTLQRAATGRVAAPLLTHLTWTVSVMLLFPLEA
jgi:membrane protease YdiL (CAAX protease family)